MTADLILHNARITTLDRACPEASAVAVQGSAITAVGSDAEVVAHRGPATRVISTPAAAVSSPA